jgi:hypothetical protein
MHSEYARPVVCPPVLYDSPGPAKTLRLQFYADRECLTCSSFLSALANDSSFRELTRGAMRAAPYVTARRGRRLGSCYMASK